MGDEAAHRHRAPTPNLIVWGCEVWPARRRVRAKPLGLQKPGNLLVFERFSYAVPAVPIHDVSGCRLERMRSVNNVLQKRTSGDRLQHLRQVGFHPLSLARGQNHDGERHGTGRRVFLVHGNAQTVQYSCNVTWRVGCCPTLEPRQLRMDLCATDIWGFETNLVLTGFRAAR